MTGTQYLWEINEDNFIHRLPGDNSLRLTQSSGVHTALRVFHGASSSEPIDDIIEVALQSAVESTFPIILSRQEHGHWGYLAFALCRLLVAAQRHDLIRFEERQILWHDAICDAVIAKKFSTESQTTTLTARLRPCSGQSV